MHDHDTARMLATLNALELLMDDSSLGITGCRQTYVSAMLAELEGEQRARDSWQGSLFAFIFAMRGCFYQSRQFRLIAELLGFSNPQSASRVAMEALWRRAHEALGELRVEICRGGMLPRDHDASGIEVHERTWI